MAKYHVFAVIGVVLLAAAITAFVLGSIPSCSTTSSYLTFGETNVDVIVDAGHPYDNSISALAKDKFVFNLTMTNGYVNIALQSQPSFNKVYGQNNIDKIESEFLAPSDGVYDFNINTPESVVINGTVSVQRLTTTATASVLYYEFGLGLAAASFLFIFYGVILRFETFYPFNK